MEFTKELIKKAKSAKSAEELLKLAKAEGVELNAEQAAKAFAELNKAGELSDEELENAAGGLCEDTAPVGVTESESEVEFVFHVGQTVECIDGFGTVRCVVEDARIFYFWGNYRPIYDLREVESGYLHKSVDQNCIEMP